MKKMISLVFGGSRGIGGIIAKTLEKRGDKVYVVSRKGSKFANNLKIDLLDENLTNSVKTEIPGLEGTLQTADDV